jgi:signal peptidase II
MTRSGRHWVVDISIALAIFVADRVVKYVSCWWLLPGISVQVGSFLGIDLLWTLTYNQGAAWGLCGGRPTALLIFRLFFIASLIVIYLKAQMTPPLRTALAVILAGACGNIVDTVIWGHVVDMIHFQFWGWNYPVFNVADIAICFGSLAIFFHTLCSKCDHS